MIKGYLKHNSEKVHFKLPENYEELTIKQLHDISEDSDLLVIFSKLTGLDLDLIRKCDNKEVAYIVSQLTTLYDAENTKVEGLSEHVESFMLDGDEFFVDSDMLNIPAGQWWDIKKYESDLKDKPFEFLVRMLSIICRPKGEEYDHQKSSNRLDLFWGLDVMTAFKIRGFFLINLMQSLDDTNHFLKKSSLVKRLLRGIVLYLKNLGVYSRFLIWLKTNIYYLRYLVRRKR